MKIQSKVLLLDPKKLTLQHIEAVEAYQKCSISSLNYKLNNESWSVLECLEHLNRYGNFYIPEIKSRIQHSKSKPLPNYKAGWFGNYFAKSMLPKRNLNKMRTFKNMNPAGSKLDKTVLSQFLEHQHQILDLLHEAEGVNLQKTKTSISISNWIKLKLGDTFRVVI